VYEAFFNSCNKLNQCENSESKVVRKLDEVSLTKIGRRRHFSSVAGTTSKKATTCSAGQKQGKELAMRQQYV
jgi:hypothetical protein